MGGYALYGVGPCVAATLRPNLNPIEMVSSKLKAFLRRIGARTLEQLIEEISEIYGLAHGTNSGTSSESQPVLSIPGDFGIVSKPWGEKSPPVGRGS